MRNPFKREEKAPPPVVINEAEPVEAAPYTVNGVGCLTFNDALDQLRLVRIALKREAVDAQIAEARAPTVVPTLPPMDASELPSLR